MPRVLSACVSVFWPMTYTPSDYMQNNNISGLLMLCAHVKVVPEDMKKIISRGIPQLSVECMSERI